MAISEDIYDQLTYRPSSNMPSEPAMEEEYNLEGLFVEPRTQERQKRTYAKKVLPLTVVSAERGKFGKDGFCRISRSGNVKKNCVSVKAKSKTKMTYKFGVKTLPKPLMKKGSAIKVKLSDCKTMATQSKCKSATVMKAPKPRKKNK